MAGEFERDNIRMLAQRRLVAGTRLACEFWISAPANRIDMPQNEQRKYISRGGEKLAAAIAAFDIDVSDSDCIDFGSHVGGFVDCLLRHDAATVVAVEPGYGVLDYRLRKDPRVIVKERTNALHFRAENLVDLITIDVGWTPQRLILPVAARCLKENAAGVLSLIKPHYEAPKEWLVGGVLRDNKRDEVFATCTTEIEEAGWTIRDRCESPIAGHGGNREEIWWLTR